jgi:hypothetical protein
MRTSEPQVKAIIATALTDDQIAVFIGDASLWVDEELAGSGLSDGRLELIERYLACAFIRARELGLTSVTAGDVSERYQTDPEISEYLLRAASFDTTGTVRNAFLAAKDSIGLQTRVGKTFTADAPIIPFSALD